jgi:hypothetical protein
VISHRHRTLAEADIMTKTIAALVVAGVAALGFAPSAHASPFSPVHVPVAAHGHGGFGIGIGFGGGGGGYYAPQPVYSGYWTTQYRMVPTTVFLGYDMYRQPVYGTQYVQQAYQVWVPVQTYAPSYGYGYGGYSPSWRVGFGYRWH